MGYELDRDWDSVFADATAGAKNELTLPCSGVDILIRIIKGYAGRKVK